MGKEIKFKEPVVEDFPFGEKMESMQGKELEERILKAWNWAMPKLTPIPYVGKIDQDVQYRYEELTGLCPVTGIQDLYTVTINFVPDKSVPELKSLKMLYLAYRNLPISHEHLQAKIFDQFKNEIDPKQLKVVLDVAVRGGIYTTVSYEE